MPVLEEKYYAGIFETKILTQSNEPQTGIRKRHFRNKSQGFGVP